MTFSDAGFLGILRVYSLLQINKRGIQVMFFLFLHENKLWVVIRSTSARQTIHMKCQALLHKKSQAIFSLKKRKKEKNGLVLLEFSFEGLIRAGDKIFIVPKPYVDIILIILLVYSRFDKEFSVWKGIIHSSNRFIRIEITLCQIFIKHMLRKIFTYCDSFSSQNHHQTGTLTS